MGDRRPGENEQAGEAGRAAAWPSRSPSAAPCASPPTPASGAASAPIANCASAEQAPTRCPPCAGGRPARARSRWGARGRCWPRPRRGSAAGRPARRRRRPRRARRGRRRGARSTSPAVSIARGPKRPTSARLTWLAAMMPHGVEREQHAEELRRDAVDVLQHERRARDVGGHRAEGEAQAERVAEELAVADAARRRRAASRRSPPPWRRPRARASRPASPTAATSSTAPMPARTTKMPRQSVTCSSCAADERREDRRQAVDEHQQREEARGGDAGVQVAHDRPRDDDPGRAGDALDERGSPSSSQMLAAMRAQQRGRHVGGQADEQRAPAPERVADRPGDELPAREAQHRRGDRQLRRPRRRARGRAPSTAARAGTCPSTAGRRRTARRGAARAGHAREGAASVPSPWTTSDPPPFRALYRQLTRACLLSMAMKFPRHLWTGEWRLESEQAREAAEEEAARRRAALRGGRARTRRRRRNGRRAAPHHQAARPSPRSPSSRPRSRAAPSPPARCCTTIRNGPAAARGLRQAGQARQGPVARRHDLRPGQPGRRLDPHRRRLGHRLPHRPQRARSSPTRTSSAAPTRVVVRFGPDGAQHRRRGARRRPVERPRRREHRSRQRPGQRQAAAARRLAPASQVGDTAIAIGNPFGLDRTATEGIVSGLGRQIQAPNGFEIDEVIQTDAPINPGNSGGPLLDDAGARDRRQLADRDRRRTRSGNVGIGFAVPSNTVRQVVPRLEQGETIARPYLGVETTDRPTPTRRRGAEVAHGRPRRPRRQRGPAAPATSSSSVDGQRGRRARPTSSRDRRRPSSPATTSTSCVERDGQRRDARRDARQPTRARTP